MKVLKASPLVRSAVKCLPRVPRFQAEISGTHAHWWACCRWEGVASGSRHLTTRPGQG